MCWDESGIINWGHTYTSAAPGRTLLEALFDSCGPNIGWTVLCLMVTFGPAIFLALMYVLMWLICAIFLDKPHTNKLN
ncbi:TPA: hypothetical protein DEP96_03660 [Candidatus Uhrbacteria bacterium]|nr:hypothetical protein [Candidatus Uhrbacteria bacterium]